MAKIASQITSLTIVYSTVYPDADRRQHQSSASLAFVRGIHRGPVNSPHKWPVTRKKFPFDDVIMSVCLFKSFKLVCKDILQFDHKASGHNQIADRILKTYQWITTTPSYCIQSDRPCHGKEYPTTWQSEINVYNANNQPSISITNVASKTLEHMSRKPNSEPHGEG